MELSYIKKQFIEFEKLIDTNIQQSYYMYETHAMDPPATLDSASVAIYEGLELLRKGINELYE